MVLLGTHEKYTNELSRRSEGVFLTEKKVGLMKHSSSSLEH